MEKLIAKASIQIQKPLHEVFNTIVMADKMSNYFIESASGNLESGKTVEWKFPEFPDIFPVTGGTIVANKYISFDWSGGQPDKLVEIFLNEQKDGSTLVKIEERMMDHTKQGVTQMMHQTEGWANFLACLKAWIEYGINLRKGAFDYMRANK